MAAFEGESDRYRGVTVRSEKATDVQDEEFPAKLDRSLEQWKEKGVRAVWFYVDLTKSAWVPALAARGFDFHHASPGVVAMVRWLPEDEANQIPQYCHNMMGVGAMVVNDKDELLVVQEKFSPVSQWKLPGGNLPTTK